MFPSGRCGQWVPHLAVSAKLCGRGSRHATGRDDLFAKDRLSGKFSAVGLAASSVSFTSLPDGSDGAPQHGAGHAFFSRGS